MTVVSVSAVVPLNLTVPRLAVPDWLRIFAVDLSATALCLLVRCAAATAWTVAAVRAADSGYGSTALALGVLAFAHLAVPGPGIRWVRLAAAGLLRAFAATAKAIPTAGTAAI